MFRSLTAGLAGVLLGVRFWRALAVRPREVKRYFSKIFGLGLCYGAFVNPPNFRGSVAAGCAAFLSCAYDLITDWRSFSDDYRHRFESELEHLVPKWAAELAMHLYWAEARDALEDDGLERGVIAVKFITGLVGSEGHFSQFGIHRLGLLLQIVDDVLDFEQDVALGEQNCLVTTRAAGYLAFLHENRHEILGLFARDRIMRSVILRADRKAQAMARELRSRNCISSHL